jgi:Domain of unknown function (DUF5666)
MTPVRIEPQPKKATRLGQALRAAWAPGLLALLALVTSACGVGTEGTGAEPPTFASGPITGFGSVIVNGVRFDDSAARVEDADGQTSNSAALRLGMVVEVDAGAITAATGAVTTPTAAASAIRYGSLMLGPIAANNLGGKTLTVLGQTVVIGVGTLFDERLVNGQAGLALSQEVEIYGLYDSASNLVRATRIEAVPSTSRVSAYRLRGVVRALDSANATLQVGGATLRHSGLSLPPGVAVGSTLRMTLATLPDNQGRWTVTSFSNPAPVPQDRQDAEVRGVVDAFTNSANFRVNGVPVNAANASFPDGVVGLGAGARVQVKGSLKLGVLVATSVKLDSDARIQTEGFEFKGTITSVNNGAKTLVIRGNTVSYADPALRIDNGSLADILVSNRAVEIKGQLSADGTRLVAQRIKFDN